MTLRQAKIVISLLVVFLVLSLILLTPGCANKPEEAIEEGLSEPLEEEEEEELLAEEEPSSEEEDSGVEEEPEAVPEDKEEPASSPSQPEPEREEQEKNAALPVIADGDYLLALVGKSTLLKSDYVPAGLVAVPSYMKPSYSMQLRDVALHNLDLLWHAAAYDGVDLSIRSAYRSYSTQAGLFKDYASRHGEEGANRFSARAGQSEHQLGTTVDFGGTSVDFSAAFAETPQGRWLADNAFNFGFALSYPAGMEHVTGYIFEPWHYRYIGVEEAVGWKASGKTLNEYLATKPQAYD